MRGSEPGEVHVFGPPDPGMLEQVGGRWCDDPDRPGRLPWEVATVFHRDARRIGISGEWVCVACGLATSSGVA